MPGDQCIVCGNTRHKDKSVSLHRLPRKESKRGRWLEALDLVEDDLKDFHGCVAGIFSGVARI